MGPACREDIFTSLKFPDRASVDQAAFQGTVHKPQIREWHCIEQITLTLTRAAGFFFVENESVYTYICALIQFNWNLL